MKKTKSIQIAASILLLSWLLISCGGDKTPTEEDVFGQDPTLPATTPAQHSAATTTQPQPNTVIADDGTTTTTTTTVDKNQLTESGFTIGEEERIGWIMKVVAAKKVGKGKSRRTVMGYRDITQNMIAKCGIFTEAYRVPLDYLNFWQRHRGERSMEAEVIAAKTNYDKWKNENWRSKKMIENLRLAKEAWDRTEAYQIELPDD